MSLAGAMQDQHDKAIEDCLRMWPDNGHLVTERLEELVLDEVAQPRQELRAAVTLLWRATGQALSLDPGDDVADMVRVSAPASTSLTCDYCEEVAQRGAFLVLPHPPRLVVLTICEPCVQWFNTLFDPIRWVLPANRED